MNKVTKKLEKLVREREAAKIVESKRKPIPPAQLTISIPKSGLGGSAGNKTKSNLNRTMSITISVVNPNKTAVYPTAFAVRHEVKKEKSFIAAHSPERVRPDKRDPILLNNNEELFSPKGKNRAYSPTKVTTLLGEEPPAQRKAWGQFSQLNYQRPESPVKLETKKINNKQRRREGDEAEVRNRRKMIPDPNRNLQNPLAGGSDKTWNPNQRKHATRPRTATQNLLADILKHSAKKPEPVRESARTPKGRVFRDTSLTMACILTENVREPSVGKRCESREHVRGNSMKHLVNYSFSSQFRPDNVSPKCNALNGSTVTKWHNDL